MFTNLFADISSPVISDRIDKTDYNYKVSTMCHHLSGCSPGEPGLSTSTWFSFSTCCRRDTLRTIGTGLFLLPLLLQMQVLVSTDGVEPSRMVGVSASVDLPLHHKVQKFSSGTSSPEWSRKKGRKTVVVWYKCRHYSDTVTLKRCRGTFKK